MEEQPVEKNYKNLSAISTLLNEMEKDDVLKILRQFINETSDDMIEEIKRAIHKREHSGFTSTQLLVFALNSKSEECTDNETDENLDLIEFEKILKDKKYNKDAFCSAIQLMFSAISNSKVEALWDTLMLDMDLMLLEYLLDPYLQGKVLVGVDGVLEEKLTFTGYKNYLQLSIDDCFLFPHELDYEIRKEDILYCNFIKTLSIDLDVAENLFATLVDTFAIPKAIWPFAFMAVYLQYLNTDREAVRIAYRKKRLAKGALLCEIAQDWEDFTHEELFVFTLDSIIPSSSYDFMLLKDRSHLDAHLNFVRFLCENAENVNFRLNCYVYNHYFPILDMMYLFSRITLPINQKYFEKFYVSLYGYTNIKPLNLKQMVLDRIVNGTVLGINKNVVGEREELFQDNSSFNCFFNQFCDAVFQQDIAYLKKTEKKELKNFYRDLEKNVLESLITTKYIPYWFMY